jgi:ankyrin repeat protein
VREDIITDIDCNDRKENTPLMKAAQIGHVGIIGKLLKFGANPK